MPPKMYVKVCPGICTIFFFILVLILILCFRLYTSPKSEKPEQLNESPSYQWLRKDVDDPENKQLQLAKKALLTKLNELEIRKHMYFNFVYLKKFSFLIILF